MLTTNENRAFLIALAGESIAEVARVVGVTERAARRLLASARQKLEAMEAESRKVGDIDAADSLRHLLDHGLDEARIRSPFAMLV